MRQYIGIVRDHSGSMSALTGKAMKDYNSVINEMKDSFGSMDTYVSTIKCGFASSITGKTSNVTECDATVLKEVPEIHHYTANGGSTPLFDAVGQLINMLNAAKLNNDLARGKDNEAFLLIIITDGQENASKIWNAHALGNQIKNLQSTDKWTFVFRVPRGYKRGLVRSLSVHEGNVVEWDQTEQGFETVTYETASAIQSYGMMRSKGVTSTDRFYMNTTHLKPQEIKQELVDVSNRVKFYHVALADMGIEIKRYVEDILRLNYVLGSAYYQLSKTETLQPQKQILVRTADNKVYTGINARQLLNLPVNRSVKVSPGNIGDIKVFIQSTSTNRHLMGDTELAIFT